MSGRIERSALGVGVSLGAGSQGSIYSVSPDRGFGLGFASLTYKEFSGRTPVSGVALEVLAGMRADMSDTDREVVDRYTVWPLAVVTDQGRIIGYLMQRVPERFMQPIATSSGIESIPREAQHLFVADTIGKKNLGEVATTLERLAIARELAFAVGFLHRHDLVFGDLSFKNEVFCLRPLPGVMLLDCDAVRKVGQGSAVPQLHSPGWKPPEGGPQTKCSDRYKLGLFVLRCLTPGVNAQNRNPEKAAAALDLGGLDLLRRSLGDVPEERTTGREWVEYLDGRIAAAGGVTKRTSPPPAIAARTVLTPARPQHAVAATSRGMPLVVAGTRPAGYGWPALRPTPSGKVPWPPPAGPAPPWIWPGPTFSRRPPASPPELSKVAGLAMCLVFLVVFVLAGIVSSTVPRSSTKSTAKPAGRSTTTTARSGSPTSSQPKPASSRSVTLGRPLAAAPGPSWVAGGTTPMLHSVDAR